ncbi:MAG: Polysaccharide pyruvyl transferase CsaB [Candidatus Woesebacteria bacterium GW2011_GWA1_37_8]|uniref:Polysaccharide pyruvyl transferase CsaB n=2 Tax=Candidatus Woeseibacteriota TaxID=1752722 RepID=A0A0G0L7H3_9BACT|nr:MAG: Polysaccharide pyruvyl transferase CsaB [Microgenomates group bacterium GW2011_GWC1_37_12b]KKQ44030.1 MAG: Polysaccharide pyruvyl transferase CsaB [Candidatus Woesebacteria bacterium GW2011_GWA1_37_8]KKQ86957.1 MAG: Polysaccharide pyruvyl transferase CsaB [Candidatus Woesebacteria bacterium GW2011_GWB1_38_8b]
MVRNSLKQVKILDININSTSNSEVLAYIEKKIEEKQKFYIVTPNPEQVLLAQDDELFKNIINAAEVSVPDGIGLIAGFKFSQLARPKKIIKRLILLLKQGFQVGLAVVFDQKWLQSDLSLIKGRKLFEELLIMADKKKLTCVFIGDDKQSAQKAAARLREKLKSVIIHAMTGPLLDKNGVLKKRVDETFEKELVERINNYTPDLLLIGFGTPKQEKWMYRLYDKLNFSCAAHVGGTFDYFSGTRKSVPKWIEDYNFEWLFRLFTGSQKPARVFAAFPQFAFRVFLNKLVNK